MTSRERVFEALKHKEPDRVPFNARLCRELQDSIQGEMPADVDYRKYYKEDIYFSAMSYPEYADRSLACLPLPDKATILNSTKLVAALKKENIVVCNSYIPGVYEHIKRFLGDENALVGMYEFPHRLRSSIERVADWLFKLNEIIATTGVDICWIGDDIGAQNSLIMSLENYREFYKPFHREQIIRIKKINQGIKVAFHCCGHIMPLVPELMDIGVDIIEAVQPEANNDLNILKSEYGSEIAFWGAIGVQSVFFSSTCEEVAEDVRSALRAMSRGGGYIAAPCHTVTSDVSSENVKTFYNTLKTYGMYPSPGDAL